MAKIEKLTKLTNIVIGVASLLLFWAEMAPRGRDFFLFLGVVLLVLCTSVWLFLLLGRYRVRKRMADSQSMKQWLAENVRFPLFLLSVVAVLNLRIPLLLSFSVAGGWGAMSSARAEIVGASYFLEEHGTALEFPAGMDVTAIVRCEHEINLGVRGGSAAWFKGWTRAWRRRYVRGPWCAPPTSGPDQRLDRTITIGPDPG